MSGGAPRDEAAWAALLGVRLPRGARERRRLRDALTLLWEWQHGPLDDVEADVAVAQELFSPLRTGKVVRERLERLGDPPRLAVAPAEPLVVTAGDRLLVTPEGRVALALLAEPETAAAAIAALLRGYRRIGEHRVRTTLDLLAGRSRPLQAPAVGLLLVLLVLDCFGAEQGLPRGDGRASGPVDRAVFEAAAAFAAAIAPSERRRLDGVRLHGGWPVGELTRRLEPSILQAGERLHLAAASHAAARETAARLLAVRQSLTVSQLARGFDALVEVLRAHAGELRRAGVPPLDAARAAEIRAQLLRCVADERRAPHG